MRTPRRTSLPHLITAAGCGLCLAWAGCMPTPENTPPRIVHIDEKPGHDLDQAKSLDDQAAALLADRNFTRAEKLLDRAIVADPDFAPAHNNLGAVYFHQSKFYPAAQQFLLAAALLPTDPKPRNGLGRVFEASGRFDDAINCYDRARALAPDNPEYLGNAARARFRRGDRTDELRTMLEKIAATDSRPAWNQWARETLTRLNRQSTTAPAAAALSDGGRKSGVVTAFSVSTTSTHASSAVSGSFRRS